MSEIGEKVTDNLGEWEDLPAITLARWQVRMVLQALGAYYDQYHEKRPSRGLPAVKAICQSEVISLLQATINDIAIQAEIVTTQDIEIVTPTRTTVAL